jgi:hypothetical protein
MVPQSSYRLKIFSSSASPFGEMERRIIPILRMRSPFDQAFLAEDVDHPRHRGVLDSQALSHLASRLRPGMLMIALRVSMRELLWPISRNLSSSWFRNCRTTNTILISIRMLWVLLPSR